MHSHLSTSGNDKQLKYPAELMSCVLAFLVQLFLQACMGHVYATCVLKLFWEALPLWHLHHCPAPLAPLVTGSECLSLSCRTGLTLETGLTYLQSCLAISLKATTSSVCAKPVSWTTPSTGLPSWVLYRPFKPAKTLWMTCRSRDSLLGTHTCKPMQNRVCCCEDTGACQHRRCFAADLRRGMVDVTGLVEYYMSHTTWHNRSTPMLLCRG